MRDWKLAKVCLGQPFASKWKFRLTGDSETYICPVVYTSVRGMRVAAVILDRQSVVPLYYQIQQGLSEQIRSGELKPGELMPSEQEIAARLGVSRMTARQALKSLCSRGLAFSQRGKGTFVSRMKLEKNFRQLLSFSEEMKDRGSQARSKVLAFERSHPEEDVVEALHLNPSEEVIFLRRVRMADSAPLCIEATHLPARLCPDLLETFEPSGSLYRALAEQYGLQVHMADEVAEASVATAVEAKLLRVRGKSPVFRFTRTAYLHNGEPVEFVKSTYRGDRCKVVNRLTRQLEIIS
jgi:GntR family transcriptional regulator, N-acetylglucosamine utilization regulator